MGNGASRSTTGEKRTSPFLVDFQTDHAGSVNCMTVNPDGTILATGSDDCTIRLWHIGPNVGANALSFLSGHTKYITCLAVSENHVISGSADNTIKKYNMSTGQCEFTYEGHTGMINRLICTGDLIISSSYDCTARCWLMDVGPTELSNPAQACLRLFRGHIRGVYPIAFVPAENEDLLGIAEEVEIAEDLLITGSTDTTARAWSMETGKCVQVMIGHTGPVQALALTENGRTLFTGSADNTIRMWKTSTGETLKIMKGHKDGVTNMLLSTWDWYIRKSLALVHRQSAMSGKVHQKYLYSGSSDRTARSWIAEMGDHSRTFKGHKHSVTCMTQYDGVLYTGCGDGVVRGYEAKTGILLRIFRGHTATINCVKCCNERLYSGAYDGVVRVWTLDEIKESDDPNRFPRQENKNDTNLVHPEDQIAARDDNAFYGDDKNDVDVNDI